MIVFTHIIGADLGTGPGGIARPAIHFGFFVIGLGVVLGVGAAFFWRRNRHLL